MFTNELRAMLRDIQRDVDDRERAYETTARRFASALILLTSLLIMVSIALPMAASNIQPNLVGFIHSSKTSLGTNQVLPNLTWQEVAGVEIWGALGALVSGIVAVRGIRPRAGDEGLSISQLVLKIPAGSITAAFGILLIQADVVPLLRPIEDGQVGAYAVLFGFAQEGVTRLIDRQAASLLNKSTAL